MLSHNWNARRSWAAWTVERSPDPASRTELVAVVAFTPQQYEDADDPSVCWGLGFEWFTFDGCSTNVSVETLSFSMPSTAVLRTRLELNITFRCDMWATCIGGSTCAAATREFVTDAGSCNRSPSLPSALAEPVATLEGNQSIGSMVERRERPN